MQVITTFVNRLQKLTSSVSETVESLQAKASLESMLQELETASESLSDALDAEVKFGEEAVAAYGNDAAPAVARWQECRAEVNRKQEAYYQAVVAFREQVPRLPRPLRAGAAELGRRAMTVRSA